MAEKRIELEDMIDPSAVPAMVKQFEELIRTMEVADAATVKLAQDMKTRLQGTGLPKSTKELKDHNDAVKASSGLEQANLDVLKKKIEAQTELATITSKLRQEAKENIIVTNSSTESYNAYVVKLRQLKEEWRAGDAALREKLTPQIKATNDKLKELDATVGVHSRNVGNYGGSIRAVTEVLRGFGRMLGFDVEGLREFTEIQRGSSHLMHGHADAAHEAAAATEEQTAANEEMAASQEATLGPIGLAIAGLATLAVVIGEVVAISKEHKKALEERSKTADGLVIVDEEERKEHEKNIETLQELIDKYDVLSGKMSQYTADLKEMTLKHRNEMQEFSNTTQKKLEESVTFLQKFAMGHWFESNKEQLDRLNSSYSGLITNEQKELQENLKRDKEEKERIQRIEKLELLQKAGLDLLQLEFGIKMKLKSVDDEAIRNTHVRALEQAKTAREQATGENNPTGSTELTQQQRDKQYEIDQEYIKKVAKINRDWAIEWKSLQLQEVVDLKTSLMAKEDIENASFEKSKSDLQQKIADGEATNVEMEALEIGHQNRLADIKREKAVIDEQIQMEADKTIQSAFEKQLRVAQDTYNNDIAAHEEMVRKKEMTDVQYAEWKVARDKELAQAEYDIETAKQNKIKNLILDNNIQAFKDQLQYDITHKLGGMHPENLQRDDKNREAAAERNKKQAQVDEQIAALENGRTVADLHGKDLEEYQAYIDKKKLIDKEYQNSVDQNNEEALKKRAEMIQKETDLMISGVRQAIDESNQRQKEGLDEQSDIIRSEMQDQTILMAAGRKNTLDAVAAEENKNAVEQAKLRDRERRQQQALDLAETLEKAVNAYISTGMDPEKAMLKALETTLMTKALATGIAGSFKKGTHKLKRQSANGIDGQGGMLIIAHPEEAIVTAEANNRVPGLTKALNEGKEEEFISRMYLPKLKNDISTQQQVGDALANILDKRLKNMEDIISNQPQMVAYNMKDGTPIIEEHKGNSTKTRVVIEAPTIYFR